MGTFKAGKGLAFAAGAVSLALAMAACSSNPSDPTPGATNTGGTDDAPVSLTIATFNNFGYTDDLLQEYMDLHPNVTITHNIAAESGDARTNYFAKLGTGGLADVEDIEIDWVPEVMKYSDMLYDLSSDSVEGRWLDWKTAAATDPDGRLLGYGTDIGPEAICYDASLFEKAGLPTDPTEVAALFAANGGGWDQYFEVGKQYQAGGGKAFFDSAAGIWQAMINQLPAAYEDPETGAIIAADNPDVKNIFWQVLEASKTLSTHLAQWNGEAMANQDFATMMCPGWMLGVIQGNAPDVTSWNVADVFPGGGGNWGGSYLTVPASGKNLEAAKALADWLTAPEQQLKAMANAGTVPSQVEVLDNKDALNEAFASGDSPTKAEYFNSTTLGTIFSNRANAVTVSPFKGVNYVSVNDAFNNGLTRVDVDKSQTIQEAWDQAISEVKAIG